MKKLVTLLVTTILAYGTCNSNAQKLVNAYKSIESCQDNYIFMKNGEKFIFNDGRVKRFKQLLNSPDIEDMFKYRYPREFVSLMGKNIDPGRIRYEPLFRSIYGNSAREVKSSLTTIRWVDGSLVKVTKKEGVDRALKRVVADLKRLPPKYKKYLSPIGGTFKWRVIAGTSRLSVHSFGAAIDINVKYSAYWRWSRGKPYKNKIPKEIVKIFEKHGFIWGGKWYHYDTMHFEYRLLLLATFLLFTLFL